MSERKHPPQPGNSRERWVTAGELRELCSRDDDAVIVDRKVARLHRLECPSAIRLTAGESAKSFGTLKRLCLAVSERRLAGARRVVAVGGGTVGDVAALAAHMVRRGMPLVHVPTTLLAAVDSSIGGKAAINSPGGGKNVFGAFHFAGECLLCEEIWTTLSPQQHRDGLVEALKMAVCLDAGLAGRWRSDPPGTREMVTEGRRLKAAARRTEDLFTELGLPGRRLLANSLRDHGWQQFQRALALDKKGLYTFVVLREIGEAETAEVPEAVVKSLFGGWRGR